MNNEFRKWFAARARTPDRITLEEAFAAGARSQHAPSVPDIDYLVDTLSEFADHHVEHGRMSFDKWTLRSAVEAMLAAAPEAKP